MIRTAVCDDLDALVELTREQHALEYPDVPFDADYLRENYRTRAIDTMDGICFVVEIDGKAEGCISAVVYKPFTVPILHAGVMSLYVRKVAKGFGRKLIREAEAWARWRGCVKMTLGYPSTARSAPLHRVYAGLGFEPSEHTYLKSL